MAKKAVVVLSGGLDSTTCMGIARKEGYDLYPITFAYGQRHDKEVEQAKKIAAFFQVSKHQVVDIRFFRQIGQSALTDPAIAVPEEGDGEGIPATYVPGRNLIFLSLAAAYAETVGARTIYIGVSAVDYSGYPDCRPPFLKNMEKTINLATRAGNEGKRIELQAPLLHLTKKETVEIGLRLGVPYELTTSCYRGGIKACGRCDSCRLRIKGFKEAGARDPIPYAVAIDWNSQTGAYS